MLVDTAVWAWIGALAMGAGTVPPLWAWYSRSSATGGSHAVYYGTLAGVTGVAALAYLAMALGVGTLSTAVGELEVVRYVDWLVTTPLILLYLGLLARPSRRVLAGLIGVDVVVIAGGVTAAATGGTVSWVAFGVAGAAYLALVYGLLVSLPRSASAAGDRVRAVFGTLRNITVVLWTLYPVVWLLAPTGFGLLTPATEMLVFVYLDIVSKVGFVVVAVAGADALDRLGADRGVAVGDSVGADAAGERTTALGDD
ncbi:sensory rhodopsin-2 [Halorubrum sp. Atlit-8R]|uniref:bacteriorhodopsin n=1 Tax=unclassified Halorubrum TaxID=2642239 RepID=UPI000EF1CCC4|nr:MULTISPECIES: bacteriorhodopsin [unclassified Halorubrum]RLM67363.1 sensory rhodopsin-2 [Halorubrum sp. Atlit-9R]RLM77523.1 sensory rhodopsin-2 [Halorubrum sp. Atlit-8R]